MAVFIYKSKALVLVFRIRMSRKENQSDKNFYIESTWETKNVSLSHLLNIYYHCKVLSSLLFVVLGRERNCLEKFVTQTMAGKSLKLVSAIFIKFSFFHQMIALQKLCKTLFMSSKKLFSFSRYSNFCISVLPAFSPCPQLL